MHTTRTVTCQGQVHITLEYGLRPRRNPILEGNMTSTAREQFANMLQAAGCRLPSSLTEHADLQAAVDAAPHGQITTSTLHTSRPRAENDRSPAMKNQ